MLEQLRPEGTGEALARICGSELHSSRIKRTAAQALARLGVPVRGAYEDFDPELKEAWILGKKGQLVARPHG